MSSENTRIEPSGSAPRPRGMLGFAVVSVVLGLLTALQIVARPSGHGDVLVGTSLKAAVGFVALWCIASIWIRRATLKRGNRGKPTVGVLVLGYVLLIVAFNLVPGLMSEAECARRASCRNNLRQIALALHIYATDHDGRFPDRLSDLYPDSTNDLSIFVCPSAGDKVSSPEEIDLNTSYAYVTGLDPQRDNPDDVLAYDKLGNHRYTIGCNVLSVDGHVRWWREEREEKLDKTLAEEEMIRSQRRQSEYQPQ